MKIADDKYYTPIPLANHCIDQVLRIVGDNISETIEPSVGNGSFLHHKDLLINFAYDIKPEISTKVNGAHIIPGDFLAQDITYLPGRLIIGNPPYGERLYMAQKFFKKAVEIADYIAFILPISQLNNTYSFYEFDLVYSEDLGVQTYSDRELHCCFNVYIRPENGLNKRPKANLDMVKIYRQDRPDYQDLPFDVRICYWGNGSAGKILQEGENYCSEYKIMVNTSNPEFKREIIEFIKGFDWRNYVQSISAKKILQRHICEALRDHFDWIR